MLGHVGGMYLLRIAKSNAHIVKPSLSCSTSSLHMPVDKADLAVLSVIARNHQKPSTSIAKPQRLLGEHAESILPPPRIATKKPHHILGNLLANEM